MTVVMVVRIIANHDIQGLRTGKRATQEGNVGDQRNDWSNDQGNDQGHDQGNDHGNDQGIDQGNDQLIWSR